MFFFCFFFGSQLKRDFQKRKSGILISVERFRSKSGVGTNILLVECRGMILVLTVCKDLISKDNKQRSQKVNFNRQVILFLLKVQTINTI